MPHMSPDYGSVIEIRRERPVCRSDLKNTLGGDLVNFKKKAENFWYHYKWHLILGVFIAILLIYAVKSMVTKKENDLFAVYISDKSISEDTGKNFEKSLIEENLMNDVNGDGEKVFYFEPLVTTMDYDAADNTTMQKLQFYMLAGEQSLMLVHKYIPEDYDGAFEDISAYASSDDEVYIGNDGYVTAICVEGNKYLESMGFDTENLYVAMHVMNDRDKDNSKRIKEYETAREIMKYILEKQNN